MQNQATFFGKNATSIDVVWNIAYSRHLEHIVEFKPHIHPAYFQGFTDLNLTHESPPSLDSLKIKLKRRGWRLFPVKGYLSPKEFFSLVSCQIFPISQSIRSIANINHSPVPDMIHDVLGHLPLLGRLPSNVAECAHEIAIRGTYIEEHATDRNLTQSVHALEEVAEFSENHVKVRFAKRRYNKALQQMYRNPTPLHYLVRLYHWLSEFAITDSGAIVGSGILSSVSEIRRISAGITPLLPANERILDLDIDFSGFQPHFFYLDGNQQQIFAALDRRMSGECKGTT